MAMSIPRPILEGSDMNQPDTSMVVRMLEMSEEIHKRTSQAVPNWIMADPAVAEWFLGPKKTPLQEFTERVWADEDVTDGS